MILGRNALIAVLGMSMLVAGCTGAGKTARPAATATPTPPAQAERDLTDEQMASLTLELADFGPRYAQFELDPDSSGSWSLTGRALQGCQPSKEAASLSKYGWVRGYARAFTPPDATGADTVAIGTYVDIYDNRDGASGKLTYDAVAIHDDTRVANGCFGFTIEGVDDLPVTGVGDQVTAVRERFSASGIRGSATMLEFRRGKVVVTVAVVRMTSEDSAEELVALAKKLDAKLQPLLGAPLS